MNAFERWKNHPGLDASLKKELEAYSPEEAHDAFYTSLQFGTAGMRGLLGAGPNRMNIYTVGKANLGYAKYLKTLSDKPRVVIATDNRHMSSEFARVCAKQFAKMGIECFLFESLRPTPELSFAVRHLSCTGGVMITASHNPKEYNGYKVYDETGCQLIPEKVDKVIKLVKEVEDELSLSFDITKEEEKLIHIISHEVDDAYKQAVLGVQLRPEVKKESLSIVFTPQHGTAYPLLPDILKTAGYQVHLVDSQCFADPDFVNTLTPNPEDPRCFEAALDLAKKVDADIILTTDPDADRMGIVVKHHGKYEYLTGNQGGTILLEYILSTLVEKDQLPNNGVIFNTIVTSDAGEALAKTFGVATEKTLTGFKYIGTKIHELESSLRKTFLFGYEESYGYLIKPFVRDKDALQSCLMLCEAAAYYQSLDKTLVDVLEDAFNKVGTYVEETVSLTFAGESGAQKIKDIMDSYRNKPLTSVGTVKVKTVEDYLTLTSVTDGQTTKLDFEKANVLKFILEDGSWIALRPSGTEPKCKFYYCVKGSSLADAQAKLEAYKRKFKVD